MIAISTRYLGPTDTRGSRIKATANGHSVTVPYPHEARQGAEAHSVAALALARKMGWAGRLISGGTDGGYVFVFADSEAFDNPDTAEMTATRESRIEALLNR